jgi:hypothetical protein
MSKPDHVAHGRKGGLARAEALSPERRREIARKASWAAVGNQKHLLNYARAWVSACFREYSSLPDILFDLTGPWLLLIMEADCKERTKGEVTDGNQ